MPTSPETVQRLLGRLNSLDALRELFQALNYDYANQGLPRRDWPDELRAACDEPRIIATAGEFQVIWSRLTGPKLSLQTERAVIERLLAGHPYALFVFSNVGAAAWHFVNVKYADDVARRRLFRRISAGMGFTGRTAAERMARIEVAAVRAPLELQTRHDKAFDVEEVTRDFFRDYRAVFESVEKQVNIPNADTRRLYTQRLFNRLMFLYFLEKKGWLEFDGDRRYLRALFKATPPDEDFLNDRLYYTFFWGLGTPADAGTSHTPEALQARRGQVPFLNGGLFDLEDGFDARGAVKLPTGAFAAILDLFERYNFTVEESTPFDVEVAVDPEMLGKVFEELVTGRHESGSYYTPRGIVAFMGREALKGYLARCDTPEAITRLVDEGDATALRDPEGVLQALRAVRVCDPACGSGAYLLGMMQELLRLREALFAARARDHQRIFDRKLEIIENNLYGVDLDPFAVNIAMLRLWLSLVIEYEGDNPPPLPNLSYKIECGDSLTAPAPQMAQQVSARDDMVRQFRDKKARFLVAHHQEKQTLKAEIEELRADIRAWTRHGQPVDGFDWAVEFAEVFAPQEPPTTVFGTLNLGLQLPSAPEPGGFDIVLANPPYVRMELFKEIKPTLRKHFSEAHSDRADLYVYFYARALQLLRPGGMLAYISPNKWLRAGYGGNLRTLLAQETTVRSITDFGDLPVFQAAIAYPMICIAQKNGAAGATFFTQVKSLDEPYPDVRALIAAHGQALPPTAINGANWTLADTTTSTRLATMRQSGVPLGEYVKGQIFYGVKTGLNTAFIIDGKTRATLIAQDPRSAQVIKPLVVGKDVKRWTVDYKDKWLIYLTHGIDASALPAVIRHLELYRAQLEQRATKQEWYELQQPQERYSKAFEKPKIVYPDIAVNARFALDSHQAFINDTTFMVPIADAYLLGVLNSSIVEKFFLEISAQVRGGYLRFKRQYVEQLPIPAATPADKSAIEALVAACLAKQGQGCAGEEAEINARVARLYGVAV